MLILLTWFQFRGAAIASVGMIKQALWKIASKCWEEMLKLVIITLYCRISHISNLIFLICCVRCSFMHSCNWKSLIYFLTCIPGQLLNLKSSQWAWPMACLNDGEPKSLMYIMYHKLMYGPLYKGLSFVWCSLFAFIMAYNW